MKCDRFYAVKVGEGMQKVRSVIGAESDGIGNLLHFDFNKLIKFRLV